MKIDDLKREQSYSIETEPHKHGFTKGYNAAIDHLASRGLIPSVAKIEGIEEAILYFQHDKHEEETPYAITWDEKMRCVLQAARAYAKLQDGAPLTSPKQEWRPIETAPKDGTDIYATRVDLVVFRPSIIYFEQHENKGWLCSQTHKPVKSQPTVWQPLPTPPQGD